MSALLDARATAQRLPYRLLAQEIEAVLRDATVAVPPRLVQPLPGGGSLFVMPALDSRIAITKLITFTPANAGSRRPVLQGDVVAFDIASGERRIVLDGPTVTARRTAAVSLLAAMRLAPDPGGALLIVGAGVQGRAHLDAFAEGLGTRRVRIASRSEANARKLLQHAQSLGLAAEWAADADAAMRDSALVVTCTPASEVVLRGPAPSGVFIAAVGAFTPRMVELDPALCHGVAQQGRIVVDTPDALHEAGDLIQAGLDISAFATLRDVVDGAAAATGRTGPVLFKSCGWAGWDLAAARCALRAGV